MLKRILLVLCWFPAVMFFLLRWVVTGRDILDGMDAFEAWLLS